MSIKEFLKPDWRKVTVFLVIIIFFLFLHLLSSYYLLSLTSGENMINSAGLSRFLPVISRIGTGEEVNRTWLWDYLNTSVISMNNARIELAEDFSSASAWLKIPLLVLSPGVENPYFYFPILTRPIYNPPTIFYRMLLLSLYWYLLSCLIIFAYGKFKDRKK